MQREVRLATEITEDDIAGELVIALSVAGQIDAASWPKAAVPYAASVASQGTSSGGWGLAVGAALLLGLYLLFPGTQRPSAQAPATLSVVSSQPSTTPGKPLAAASFPVPAKASSTAPTPPGPARLATSKPISVPTPSEVEPKLAPEPKGLDQSDTAASSPPLPPLTSPPDLPTQAPALDVLRNWQDRM